MDYKFETKAIHCGQEPDMETGAVIPPIHLSSTFRQSEVGVHKGFEYSRTGNPTRQRLEQQVAALEHAKYGIAFSSGSAATSTMQLLLESGDHVICGDDVYGGTYRFFDKVMKKFGVSYDFVDLSNPDNLKNSIKDNTKMVWLETPTNPLLKISDLTALSEIAQQNDIISVVDNTFASPFLQNPIKLGADVVVHSSTKYLGGHSDLVGGIVVTNNEEFTEKLQFLQNASGGIPSPFDCWLLMRGIKTLAVRMTQHSKSATKVVEYLSQLNFIENIYYPFLDSHNNSEVAKQQMKYAGGILSFDLPSAASAHAFLKKLNLFYLAESLGGVESLAEYPPTMTHGAIEPDRRHEIGINDGLVRLSVGLENVEDLIEDISQAMEH